MKRVRLDDELVAQGICVDRADALRTLMAGDVSARGERLTSPGMMVDPAFLCMSRGVFPMLGGEVLSSRVRSMPSAWILPALRAEISGARLAALPIAFLSAVLPRLLQSMLVERSSHGR